jgi:hypothetical protein
MHLNPRANAAKFTPFVVTDKAKNSNKHCTEIIQHISKKFLACVFDLSIISDMLFMLLYAEILKQE